MELRKGSFAGPEDPAALFFNSKFWLRGNTWSVDRGVHGALEGCFRLMVLRTAGYQVPHQVPEAIQSLPLGATFPGL